jgi:hypothetical protein
MHLVQALMSVSAFAVCWYFNKVAVMESSAVRDVFLVIAFGYVDLRRAEGVNCE